MRTYPVALAVVLSGALLLAVPPSNGDTVKFADGTEIEGVIKKVEGGRVFILIGEEERVFGILDIASMDFNTPHLMPAAANVPLDHFLKDIEAQELVRNIEELKKAEEEIRRRLVWIRSYWGQKPSVSATEITAWEATKKEFEKPLNRYQELLNDMYFHVLAQVDAYNTLATEASKVYVGVRGIRTGSSLVAKDNRKLPLKLFVPANWYNTIFYDGYNVGFNEAQIKMNSSQNHE
jgi:hypothetical protein